MKGTESPKLFLSGREFTAEEIQDIQETIESCGLSWHELLHTICEHLDWVTAAGHDKVGSCARALKKLEARGLVKLPETRACKGRSQEIELGEGTSPEEEIKGTARDYEPIELEPVTSKELVRLWSA